MKRLATLLILAATGWSACLAQTGSPPFGEPSAPSVGGTGGLEPPERLPTFGASSDTEILRHRSPTGAPCLSVGGFARPHVINPNLYDHVIVVKNSCALNVGLKVCYYRSDDCISMDVPGGESKEAILGMVPSENDFRFEFREKF
jgi:hypothetical protein